MLPLANKFNGSVRRNAGQSKLTSNLISDKEILEFKTKTGYGIEKTAKELGCTTYRVRQCLKNNGVGDSK